MNFKNFCFALLAIVLVGCTKNTVATFDYAAQYVKEKPIIDTYIATHYFDDDTQEINVITNSETQKSLKDDSRLEALKDTVNDVDYTMYSFVYKVGTEESPDADDTVNIAYKLTPLLDQTIIYDESDAQDSFLNLPNVIEGWRVGLTVFKGGDSSEAVENVPREYTNGGKGYMIIPSGLGYGNNGSGSIGPNETLLFKITLRTVTKKGEDL